MSEEPDNMNLELRAKLVDRIYASALNPSDYWKVFEAWDQHFETLELNGGSEEAENFDWAREFVLHFERAGEVFDNLPIQSRLTIEQQVDRLNSAAIACRLDGSLIHANIAARHLVEQCTSNSIFDLSFDATSCKILKNYMREGTETQHFRERKTILRTYPNIEQDPIFLVAELIEHNGNGSEPSKYLHFRSVSIQWGKEIEDTLRQAFEVTDAELNLIANLYKGYSIKEIATVRGRTQATLRTQLSSILGKTSTKNQTALLRLVASLAHITESANGRAHHHTPRPHLACAIKQRTGLMELSNGLQLEYVESGDLDGAPFYFVQSSTTPTLTPQIVEALERKNVRLISPVRPGNGRTTKAPVSMTAADWSQCHVELIDRLGIDSLACGGHCSGGVYGLDLARELGPRCKGLLLVDFGAPLDRLSMFYAMPASPRRHFLASRYFPRATLTPIKFVAADFHSGPEGEARAVDYFYDGSPADQSILHEGDNWQITRDNIAYCFCNIPQLVRDVSLWMRDNSQALAQVASSCPIHFFHGGENRMLKPEWIIDYCTRTPNTSCRIVKGSGQLLIYTNPDIFAEEIANLTW